MSAATRALVIVPLESTVLEVSHCSFDAHVPRVASKEGHLVEGQKH